MKAEGEACPTTPTQKASGGREHLQSCFLIMNLCGGERMYHFRFDREMPLLLFLSFSVIQLATLSRLHLPEVATLLLETCGVFPSLFNSEET